MYVLAQDDEYMIIILSTNYLLCLYRDSSTFHHIPFSYVQMIILHIIVGSIYHIDQIADCPIQAWYQFWPELPYQTNWWLSWSWFTVRIPGSWHRALGGFWEYSTTGWSVSWWVGNPREDRTEYGSIPLCWKMQGFRRWRPTSLTARTKLHILLQTRLLCNYLWQRSGGLGEGWLISGGINIDWIWRGWRRRIRRRNGQRGGVRWTEEIPRPIWIESVWV